MVTWNNVAKTSGFALGGDGKVGFNADFSKILEAAAEKDPEFGKYLMGKVKEMFEGDKVGEWIDKGGQLLVNGWEVGKEAWITGMQQQYLNSRVDLEDRAMKLATESQSDQAALQDKALTYQYELAKDTNALKQEVAKDAKEVELVKIKAQKDVALETAKYQHLSNTFLTPRTYGKPTVV